MKGGKIAEIHHGRKIGLYAQVPNGMQHQSLINMHKCYVECYKDEACTIPALDHDRQIKGITDISNLKFIGFYD